MLGRLIGAAIEAAPHGQQVDVNVRPSAGQLAISVTRPVATRHLLDEQIMDPSFSEMDEGPARLGLGFALRLVRGLARLAGGDLRITPDELQLLVPA